MSGTYSCGGTSSIFAAVSALFQPLMTNSVYQQRACNHLCLENMKNQMTPLYPYLARLGLVVMQSSVSISQCLFL
ncbi:hypothetical protein MKX01_025285 [Papaver californicum]|nr:hypothetical protein MKX01_025285 [Papaver californicum]